MPVTTGSVTGVRVTHRRADVTALDPERTYGLVYAPFRAFNHLHTLDAQRAALERIRASTVESRLLNERGEPAFDVRFFILNRAGEHAGVAMYGARESRYAVCDENGAEERPLEGLLDGAPRG
jgi:hypothetical protein